MLILKIQIFQVADTLPNLTPDVISDPVSLLLKRKVMLQEMFYPIGTLVGVLQPSLEPKVALLGAEHGVRDGSTGPPGPGGPLK